MNKRTVVGPATRFIAGELRAQRARLGWTFYDVADRTGVPRSTAERLMRGDSAIPVEHLMQLCIGMGMSVGALLDEAARTAENEPD